MRAPIPAAKALNEAQFSVSGEWTPPAPVQAAVTITQPPPVPTRTVLADPPRLTALRLAIQSYGPVTTPGVEQNILQRARMFDTYLNGETDNRV